MYTLLIVLASVIGTLFTLSVVIFGWHGSRVFANFMFGIFLAKITGRRPW